MTPVGPSSAASASFYGASLKGLKYPTDDGSRKSNPSQHLLDDWTFFKSALRRRFVQWNAASTDTQKLLYGLQKSGSAWSYFTQLRHVRMLSHAIPDSLLFNLVFVYVKPHCRVALTQLQQLRSTDKLPLDEIEEACIREDEAEFARVSSSRAPVFQQKPQQTQQQSASSQRPCPVCGEPHM
ncbi:hypothetical protein Efla_000190 [Eimeria flavescens]